MPQEWAFIVLQDSCNGYHCGARQLLLSAVLIMLWISRSVQLLLMSD